MEIRLPELAFVVLIGTDGAGKSAFAQRYFAPEEIISYATFAALTGDDGSDPELQAQTLDLLVRTVEIRLQRRRPCVVVGEFHSQDKRGPLRQLARKYHCRLAAIVMDTPVPDCLAAMQAAGLPANKERLLQQRHEMEGTLPHLKEEGLRPAYTVQPSQKEISVKRYKAPSDLRHLHGPFDIVGDVHGCRSELLTLLTELGYELNVPDADHKREWLSHPRGRKLIFVGDLCDRGPDSPGVLRLVMDAVRDGIAFAVPGNHDDKLMRKLNGNNVQLKHGLERTMEQLAGHSAEALEEIRLFIDGLSSHLEFDGGQLVVAHAGIKERMHGRAGAEIHSFCLYGETTGETDEFGLPVRFNWAGDYEGKALVVYGHTPIPEPNWQNNTVNIDTGCVFGGALTALRYPERSTVSVPAEREWAKPSRPMHWTQDKGKLQGLDLSIDMNFTNPKVLVTTADGYALNLDDLMFSNMAKHLGYRGVNSRWLIYPPINPGPPTASPLPGLLDHPAQAFDYYRKKGVGQLCARPLTAGTTVVLVLCRNAQVAQRRFGVQGEGIGTVYTRSGRPYFATQEALQAFLQELAEQANAAQLWDALGSEWLCLEAVVSPLAHKAPDWVREVYTHVVGAGKHSLSRAGALLKAAQARGLDLSSTTEHLEGERMAVEALEKAARVWGSATSPTRWVPQQLLATEGKVWVGAAQTEQEKVLRSLTALWSVHFAMPAWQFPDLDSDSSLRALTAWWEEMNQAGQPGVIIGPSQWRVDKSEEMMQSWIKVRCKEFLRLSYGPHYDRPEVLALLGDRNLRLQRETLARQHSLGKDALTRFVSGRSFQEVYQAAFTSMALDLRTVDVRR